MGDDHRAMLVGVDQITGRYGHAIYHHVTAEIGDMHMGVARAYITGQKLEPFGAVVNVADAAIGNDTGTP